MQISTNYDVPNFKMNSNQQNVPNPQFKARFTEAQIREMLNPKYRFVNKNMFEFVPKLYVLLERLDKIMPDKLAVLKKVDINKCYAEDIIEIDGKKFFHTQFKLNNDEVDILSKMLIDGCGEFQTMHNKHAHMPKHVFGIKWWDIYEKMEKGEITVEDMIKRFAYKSQ